MKNIKNKITAAILTFCLLLGLCAAIPQKAEAAKTFTVGNIKYKVTSDDEDDGYGYCIVIGGKNKNITSVELDNNFVETKTRDYACVGIKKGAFKNYKKLKKVEIDIDEGSNPNKVPDNCFAGCTSLKKVFLGEGVKKIGKNAFKNCKKLGQIELLADNMKQSSFGTNSFKGTKKGIKVSAQSKSDAKKYAKYMKKRGAKNPKAVAGSMEGEGDDEDDDEDDE